MSTDAQNRYLPPANETPDEGIDLVAIAAAFLSEWRLALATTFLISLLSLLYILSLKPEFVAKVSFVPKDTRDASAIASIFSNRGPDALYQGLLMSRSVQQDVIDRVNLMPVLGTKNREVASNILLGKTTVEEAPTTIVSVSVRDGNAELAAQIANAYLDALQDVIDQMSLQPSEQTTNFFETQLQKERMALSLAEDKLAATQHSTGIVSQDSQTQIGLSSIAGLRSQITDTQVRLSSLLQSETEQNPEVVRLRSQLGELESKERTLEGYGSTPLGAAPSAGQMPQTNLDIERAQRDVRYHEQLVTSLAAQFETAKLNQDFTRPVFQIVDRAIAPEHKAWPPRVPYMLAGIAFAVLASIFVVVLRLMWRRISAAPGHKERLRTLRQSFRRA